MLYINGHFNGQIINQEEILLRFKYLQKTMSFWQFLQLILYIINNKVTHNRLYKLFNKVSLLITNKHFKPSKTFLYKLS